MIDRAEAVSRQVDILRSTGELSPAELEAIGIRLQEYADEAAEPVFVRALLALGGWFAALFLILAAQFVLQGRGVLPAGLAWLAVGAGLSRTGRGVFSSHLALALVFAGDLGILSGIASGMEGGAFGILSVLQFFLCLILYPILPLAAFRFAGPFSVAALAAAWAIEGNALWFFHLLIGAELVLFLALSLRERPISACLPLEKAAALLLPMTLLVFHLALIFHPTPPAVPLWPSGLLPYAALIVLIFHPSVALPVLFGRSNAPLLTIVLLLGLFASPGVTAALLLLILGRARSQGYLTVLGGLFLPVFLGFWYYDLNIDPVYKAWVIAGSGVLLLLVRRMGTHSRPGEDMS